MTAATVPIISSVVTGCTSSTCRQSKQHAEPWTLRRSHWVLTRITFLGLHDQALSCDPDEHLNCTALACRLTAARHRLCG